MTLKNLLRASFLLTLKGHKHRHVHTGNARTQRGYRESGTPPPPENNKFYRKKQLDPITLEKVGPPDILTPPLPFLDSGKIIVSLK